MFKVWLLQLLGFQSGLAPNHQLSRSNGIQLPLASGLSGPTTRGLVVHCNSHTDEEKKHFQFSSLAKKGGELVKTNVEPGTAACQNDLSFLAHCEAPCYFESVKATAGFLVL